MATLGYAQKKMNKTSQSIKVNKDVVVELNASYAEIELDTWNKDIVGIEAYIEGEKLSEDELKQALKDWHLKIDGSPEKVIITSEGKGSFGVIGEGDYAVLVQNLEFELADLPEIPQIPEMPQMPELAEFPKMPELPKLPKMPKLPELPKNVNAITFDYERYQKEGEKYLEEWSKTYEKEGGKELQQRMEDWARKFGESGYHEKMAEWGEEYGKRFEGEWAKAIEKWGEKFGEKYGKDMEKWGEEYGEKFGKEWEERMKVWSERFGKQMEERAKILEERTEAMQKRNEAMAERSDKMAERIEQLKTRKHGLNETVIVRPLEYGNNSKVKKVIKIKIPKKAKIKTNIRHGELKLSSVVHNMRGDISHSLLIADHIDGSDTSINVSYSPVMIDTWNVGTLNLNFVDKAQIKMVQNVMLNSKSSNITIGNLGNTAIIDGSFGDLTISNFTETFKNLNIVLENSDAFISLPKDLDYILYFKGDRSKYNNKVTTQKTIRNTTDNIASNRNIIVNAKYSNVIAN